MKVMIRTFGHLKQKFGESREIEVDSGGTPGNILRSILFPDRDGYSAIFDDQGTLRTHIVLMVNRKRISPADIEQIALHDGDELAVLPPVAGG